jgi:hypothetical protein
MDVFAIITKTFLSAFFSSPFIHRAHFVSKHCDVSQMVVELISYRLLFRINYLLLRLRVRVDWLWSILNRIHVTSHIAIAEGVGVGRPSFTKWENPVFSIISSDISNQVVVINSWSLFNSFFAAKNCFFFRLKFCWIIWRHRLPSRPLAFFLDCFFFCFVVNRF